MKGILGMSRRAPPAGLTGRQQSHDGCHSGARVEERDHLEVREHRHDGDDVGEESSDLICVIKVAEIAEFVGVDSNGGAVLSLPK